MLVEKNYMYMDEENEESANDKGKKSDVKTQAKACASIETVTRATIINAAHFPSMTVMRYDTNKFPLGKLSNCKKLSVGVCSPERLGETVTN